MSEDLNGAISDLEKAEAEIDRLKALLRRAMEMWIDSRSLLAKDVEAALGS